MMRFAFGHGGYEAPGYVRQLLAKLGAIVLVDAAHEIVLLVRHNPGAGRVAVVPGSGVAEIGGFHGAGVIIVAVDLGVAVVGAADGAEVVAADDPILAFGLVVP